MAASPRLSNLRNSVSREALTVAHDGRATDRRRAGAFERVAEIRPRQANHHRRSWDSLVTLEGDLVWLYRPKRGRV